MGDAYAIRYFDDSGKEDEVYVSADEYYAFKKMLIEKGIRFGAYGPTWALHVLVPEGETKQLPPLEDIYDRSGVIRSEYRV